ncbi:MAG: leucine-rich repeat domain-containing protein [Alistipes sp.]|nr:leucine-rich repeat domain-containing protein [Alistipes sp.]
MSEHILEPVVQSIEHGLVAFPLLNIADELERSDVERLAVIVIAVFQQLIFAVAFDADLRKFLGMLRIVGKGEGIDGILERGIPVIIGAFLRGKIQREFYWLTPDFTIPNRVTSIEESAFESCCGLKSITIPNCVRYIGRYAFCRCNNLTSVYCKATIPPTVKLDLVGYGPTPDKIYVPTASVETYKAAKYWSKYSWCIVGYDF